MKEKYYTRWEGDKIIVTRNSDRKTIAFPRRDCEDVNGKVSPYKTAIALAKGRDEWEWR